jgi:sigma-B regulation protein RsbU (phosphoserine phosphatase)
LGVIEQAQWEPRTLELAPGEALVLYTDGVTDAEDRTGRFYGNERLQAAIRRAAGLSATGMRDMILADIETFSHGASQFDDIALLVLCRKVA